MGTVSIISALAPLIIDWAKERRKNKEDASASAFREWLQQVAIPELLNSASTTYQILTTSQKAHHAELVTVLDRQFAQVNATLNQLIEGQARKQTLLGRWDDLRGAGQALLMQLAARVSGDTYEDAQLVSPFAVEGASKEEVESARRRIVEAGLCRHTEYAGGAVLRLTPLGYVVFYAVNVPEEFVRHLLKIQGGLNDCQWAPIDKLVAFSLGQCKSALIYAICERWDEIGLVSIQRLDQRIHSRINQPSRQMLDANIDDLASLTLKKFIEG